MPKTAAKPSEAYPSRLHSNELIIWILIPLNPLVISRMQWWIDYLNTELTSHFKNQYQIAFLNIKPISCILGTTSGFDIPNILSNYWMRLSRIWRILQFKEDVIHRGRRNNSYRKDFASFHHSKPISSPRFTPAIFSTPHTFWTDMSYFYYLIPFSLFLNAKVAKTVFLNVINSACIACCLFILLGT